MIESVSATVDAAIVRRNSCKALLITCSDFRFKSLERNFALQLGLSDDYDLIARPGSIRSLVVPRNAAARDTLAEEVRMLWAAHGFTRIIAVNHISCRAYDDLATQANERDIHTGHLRRARAVLDGLFAATSAETYLAAIVDGVLAVQPVE